MRRVGRWAMLLAVMLPAGCGASKRPYAHDPLLRDGCGVWGDHGRARTQDYRPTPEPQAPHAPKPTDLPTLEWEVTTHFPPRRVNATVPLSCPVRTPFPSLVNAMQ